MDKSWMKKKRFSTDYIQGVRSFISFIEQHLGHNDDVHCPCKRCLNVYKEPLEGVFAHLMINGIDHGYTTWVYHGEPSHSHMNDITNGDVDNVVGGDEDFDDELFDLLDEYQNFIHSEVSDGGDLTDKSYEDCVEMLGTGCFVSYVHFKQKAQQESGELSKMEFFKWLDTKDTGVWRNPHKKEQYESLTYEK
ncbi:unnamed protein product [Linum trigynum]|uniref:Transposase-associated domain-containing protein n=1 Tax=Linum trigynum TaxID=586398 RepID=A0AAV2FVK7_9ROSI